MRTAGLCRTLHSVQVHQIAGSKSMCIPYACFPLIFSIPLQWIALESPNTGRICTLPFVQGYRLRHHTFLPLQVERKPKNKNKKDRKSRNAMRDSGSAFLSCMDCMSKISKRYFSYFVMEPHLRFLYFIIRFLQF